MRKCPKRFNSVPAGALRVPAPPAPNVGTGSRGVSPGPAKRDRIDPVDRSEGDPGARKVPAGAELERLWCVFMNRPGQDRSRASGFQSSRALALCKEASGRLRGSMQDVLRDRQQRTLSSLQLDAPAPDPDPADLRDRRRQLIKTRSRVLRGESKMAQVGARSALQATHLTLEA